MASLHHVNLGVPVGGADAEGAFLVDFPGYQPVQLAAADPPTARWFESEDGRQSIVLQLAPVSSWIW
jgi:hypothetical protein